LRLVGLPLLLSGVPAERILLTESCRADLPCLATHFSFLCLDWHSSHSTLPTQHFAKLGLRSYSTTCIVKLTIFISATDQDLFLTCCYLQASPGRQATRRHVLGYLYGHLTCTFASRGLKLTRNSDIGTADRLPSLLRITTLRRSSQISGVARQHRARVARDLRSHCHQLDRGHRCRAFSVREEVIQPTHRTKRLPRQYPERIHTRTRPQPTRSEDVVSSNAAISDVHSVANINSKVNLRISQSTGVQNAHSAAGHPDHLPCHSRDADGAARSPCSSTARHQECGRLDSSRWRSIRVDYAISAAYGANFVERTPRTKPQLRLDDTSYGNHISVPPLLGINCGSPSAQCGI